MVLLNETSLDRVINKHLKEVCFMISASTSDNTEVENNIRTKELKRDIVSLGLSFIPVGGGYKYKELESGKEKEGIEKSFIVLPYRYGTKSVNGEKVKENSISTKELFSIAKELTKKYNQESFLFVNNEGKSKGDVIAKYYSSDGRAVSWSSGFKGLTVNDLTEVYFTSLQNKGKDKKKTGKADKRFTMTEDIFVEKMESRNEAKAKASTGQVLDPFQFFFK